MLASSHPPARKPSFEYRQHRPYPRPHNPSFVFKLRIWNFEPPSRLSRIQIDGIQAVLEAQATLRLLQPIPHHVLRAFPALYKPRDGNRNGRALVWQTSDHLCHISKGYNAQDIVRLGMADSISDVLRKELCLFIHRNGLRSESALNRSVSMLLR